MLSSTTRRACRRVKGHPGRSRSIHRHSTSTHRRPRPPRRPRHHPRYARSCDTLSLSVTLLQLQHAVATSKDQSREQRLFESTSTHPASAIVRPRPPMLDPVVVKQEGNSDDDQEEDEEFVAATPPLAKRFKSMYGRCFIFLKLANERNRYGAAQASGVPQELVHDTDDEDETVPPSP